MGTDEVDLLITEAHTWFDRQAVERSNLQLVLLGAEHTLNKLIRK
jgi:hypothetical protein